MPDTASRLVLGHKSGAEQLFGSINENSRGFVEHFGHLDDGLGLPRNGQNSKETTSIGGKLRQTGLKEILHRRGNRGLGRLATEFHSTRVRFGG
jgi:hypothetical protein